MPNSLNTVSSTLNFRPFEMIGISDGCFATACTCSLPFKLGVRAEIREREREIKSRIIIQLSCPRGVGNWVKLQFHVQYTRGDGRRMHLLFFLLRVPVPLH